MAPWHGCEPFHSQPDDPSATGPPSGQPNVPANSRQSGPRAPLPVSYLAISLITATAGRHRRPQKRLQTARRTSHLPQWSPGYLPCSSLTPLPLSFGGFGLSVLAVRLARPADRDEPRLRRLPEACRDVQASAIAVLLERRGSASGPLLCSASSPLCSASSLYSGRLLIPRRSRPIAQRGPGMAQHPAGAPLRDSEGLLDVVDAAAAAGRA